MKTNHKESYPRIKQLGLTIVTDDPNSIPGIKWTELKEKLLNLPAPANYKKDYYLQLFYKLYGVQTQGINGAYVYDVEAVLERIFSGKLTGTQHPDLWD